MSGVGITGLIEPLNGGSFPVFEDINGLGGYRVVADTPARDAIPANSRKLDMLVTTQDSGLRYRLVGGLLNANWQLDMGQAPCKGFYYVDPTFTGQQTGSQSNPFTSIALAFAGAAAAGFTRGIIYLAPGSNTVENVVFPAGDWEIASPLVMGLFVTTITGNVTADSAASSRRTLTNVNVTGNLSGNSSAGSSRISLSGVQIGGTTALTVGGAGTQILVTRGDIDGAASGNLISTVSFIGTVSLAGKFFGSNAIFFGALTLSVAATHSFTACDMPPAVTATATVQLFMNGCSNTSGGPIAYTASGGGSILLRPDFPTLSEMQRVGLTLTGAVTIQSLIGRSSVGLLTGNVGPNLLASPIPPGLQVCEACLTLVANGGTAVGLAVLNVIYTDATGTVVTEPVTTALNVAGALGSKARGSLPFSQNGAGNVSFSVTGVTTATGLSYECDVAVRQAS